MIPGQSTLQLAYGVAVVTSIALCVVLWHYRDRTGAMALLVYVVTGLLWSGNQLLNVTVQNVAVSAALYRLLYVTIAIGTVALFVFTLEYTGRERYLGRSLYAALAVHPIAILVFAVADPGGHFFGPIESAPSSSIGVIHEPGIALIAHLVYTYAIVGLSIAMFMGLLYRTRSVYRIQGLALVGSVVLIALPPLALFAGYLEFDATPLVMPLVSGIFTVAIVKFQLIDLVPIARDRILDEISNGIFVVDRNDHLVDVNPMGQWILSVVGGIDTDVVGRDITSLFAETDFEQQYLEMTATPTETTTGFSVGANEFDLTTSPIHDDQDRHVGWLCLFRDVTERNRREAALERQNESLEQFSDLVAHDLRNPLNVADGSLKQLQKPDVDETEPHYDRIDRSYDRMEAIIEDVLTIAREGTDATTPETISLESVAHRAWANVDTDDATLEIRSNGQFRGDSSHVIRLLENLFRNAVEHGSTGSGSHIRQDTVEHDSTNRDSSLVVTVGITDDTGDERLLYVEDDGVGISSDDRERIFEDGYSTTRYGTGLGLSIVSQIADAHDWSVRATESATGGARFEFPGIEPGHSGPTDDPSPSRDVQQSGSTR